MYLNTSKSSFSHSSNKGVSPCKKDGVPYLMKKLVDFIKATQNQVD